MKLNDIEKLEQSVGKLAALHKEVGQLAKKSPNDAINKFKLGYINAILAEGNAALGIGRRPLAGFEVFDADAVPTNSDVTLVVAQYIEALDILRSENIRLQNGRWVYDVEDSDKRLYTGPPVSSVRGK